MAQPLTYTLNLANAGFVGPVNQSRAALNSFKGAAVGAGAGVKGAGAAAGVASVGFTALNASLGPVGLALAAVAAAVAVFKTVAKGVTLAADLEKAEVAFKAVAGSAEKGNAILAVVKQTAVDTGTAFDEMSKASQKLISSRIPEGALSSEMKALSTIAKVTGGDLNGLARAYAQVAGTGRVQGDELEQFADQGAGAIKQEMADILGVSQATFRKMQEEGKVGFSVLQQAVQRLGGETGKWSSALKDSSTTTIGLLGRITSNVGQMLAAFGKPINDGPIKAVLTRVAEFSGRAAAIASAAIEQGKIAETLLNVLMLGAKLGFNAVVDIGKSLPQRLAPMLLTLAKAMQAALTGSFDVAKNLLASFNPGDLKFDTSGEEKFLNDLVSKSKASAGVLEQAAENWSKALDSTPDDSSSTKAAAGGLHQERNPKAFRPDGTPRKLSSSDRLYDDEWRRLSDGRRKIFGGVSKNNSGGASGLAGFYRLQERTGREEKGAPGVRVPGGPRMYEAFGTGLTEAAKKALAKGGLSAVVPSKDLTTPGQATKREQQQAVAQQQAKEQRQRWDLVAAIEGHIRGLAVA